MRKKLFSKTGIALLLVLVMCIGMLPTTALAAEGEGALTCDMTGHSHDEICAVDLVDKPTYFVNTGDKITVNVYGPCGYLGTKYLTAGMYIQVPCYIEPLSHWLRGTAYENYTYSNVYVTFNPPAYFPSSL